MSLDQCLLQIDEYNEEPGNIRVLEYLYERLGNIQIIMAISLMLRRFVDGLPIQVLVESLLESLRAKLQILREKIARYQEPIRTNHCQVSGANQSLHRNKVRAVDVDILFHWSVLKFFAVHACHGQRLQIALESVPKLFKEEKRNTT